MKTRPSVRLSTRIAAVISLLTAVLAVGANPASASSGTVFVNEGESIQAAIDAADPGTRIIVKGDHVENVTISTDGITLQGRNATLTMPAEPAPAPEVCQPAPGVAALVCVVPAGTTFATPPTTRIHGVSISGFTLHNPTYDAVNIAFTDDVEVEGNTVVSPGCDGIFVIFGNDVRVNRNTVTGAECSGIAINASSTVRVQRNTTSGAAFNGIAINDVTRVVVHRNSASGNCIGIGVVDGMDGGYGVRAEDFSGDIARISNNVTNGNNTTCPFGPGFVVGGTGIIVAGVNHVTVKGNTADRNVVTEESLTAGGVVITDFPNEDGSFSITNNARVTNNSANGNSSPVGPRDLEVTTEGTNIRVSGNSCGVGFPDPGYCS